MNYPETKELDKMLAVKDESQSIGNFIDWLHNEGYGICEYEEARDMGEWFQTHRTIEQLLADYFDIDLDKIEKERTAVLEFVRHTNNL
jgi:hypothetical protein